MSMGISERLEFNALKRQVAAQAQQIAALEARLGNQTPHAPEPLKQRNATRQAEATRSRQAISDALAAHSEPDRLTAKHVLRALERANFAPLPSERTVLRHLAALRRHGQTACVG